MGAQPRRVARSGANRTAAEAFTGDAGLPARERASEVNARDVGVLERIAGACNVRLEEGNALRQPEVGAADPGQQLDLLFEGESGEGNQAYGYGLYFASQRAIAEHYRRLGRGGNADWTVPGAGHLPEWVALDVQRALWNPDRYDINALIEDFKTRVTEAETAVREPRPQWWNDQTNLPGLRDIVESLEHMRDTGAVPQRPGKVYTVDIPDEHYLSFDQRLSQQTPQVQEALHRMGIDWTPLPRPTLTEAAELFEHPLVREQPEANAVEGPRLPIPDTRFARQNDAF